MDQNELLEFPSTPIGVCTITLVLAPPIHGHSREDAAIQLQSSPHEGAPYLTWRWGIWLRSPGTNMHWTSNVDHD